MSQANRLYLFRKAPCYAWKRWLAGIGCAWLLSASNAPVVAQNAPASRLLSPEEAAALVQPVRIDVAILVNPVSQDTARVALNYRQKVSHTSVREQIARLQAAGWQVGSDVHVVDDTIHPEDLKRYPLTTGAFFTLTHAPQVVNGAPALMPYVRAFQSWNNVEVIFHLPELRPYNGVESYTTDALAIQLVRGMDTYRYVAAIRDHHGTLPEPSLPSHPAQSEDTTSAAPKAANAKSATEPSSVSVLPLALTVLGIGLISGAVGYLALARRNQTRSSARPSR